MSLEESGRFLKERRIALGLTLREVQHSTKIRGRYLEALEENQPGILPPAPYTRGIIRRYCEELHLDPIPVLEAYTQWLKDEEIESPAKGIRAAPGSRGITLRATGGSRSAWVFGVLLLVAVIAVGAIYYYVALPAGLWGGRDEPENAVPAEEPAEGNEAEESPAEEPAEEDPSPAEPEPEPDREVIGTESGSTFEYRVVGVETLRVTLRTAHACWVRVEADGTTISETTMGAGSSQTWSAEEELYIRAGNPAELAVEVNDMDAGTIRAGTPRNLHFTRAQ